MTAIKRGFEDAALGLPVMEQSVEYRNGYAIAEAVKETRHLFKEPMQRFVAKEPGKYLSMTVDGRNISIHESRYLEEGDTMLRPDDAFIMLVVDSPENNER